MRGAPARLRRIALAPLLLLLGCALHGSPPEGEVDAIAAELMARLERGDPLGAAALFHYPEDLSDAEREQDLRGVAEKLAVLSEIWGVPAEIHAGSPPDEVVQIGVFGGTIPYWSSRPQQGIDALRVHGVRFTRAGSGFVAIAFHHSGGQSRVRSLGYAVDARREDAEALLLRSFSQMEETLRR